MAARAASLSVWLPVKARVEPREAEAPVTAPVCRAAPDLGETPAPAEERPAPLVAVPEPLSEALTAAPPVALPAAGTLDTRLEVRA